VPSRAEREQWRQSGYLTARPAEAWEHVRVPVLAIWGERDLFVPVTESAAGIRAALGRAGNANVSVVIFAGADHGMTVPGGRAAGIGLVTSGIAGGALLAYSVKRWYPGSEPSGR
jgi:pimeloyl-ACP methyl ester carboxylesterase